MAESPETRVAALERLVGDTIDLVTEIGLSQDRTTEAFLAVLKFHARRVMELESQLLVLTLRLNSRN